MKIAVSRLFRGQSCDLGGGRNEEGGKRGVGRRDWYLERDPSKEEKRGTEKGCKGPRRTSAPSMTLILQINLESTSNILHPPMPHIQYTLPNASSRKM
jgi:hypothetical protein